MDLLAQVDSLSGGGGWLGAGLLGLVLGWLLLRHLPEKDRQIKEILDAKDKQFTELLDAKDKQIDEQRKEFACSMEKMVQAFRDESGIERASCDKRFDMLAASLSSLTDFLAKRAKAAAERKGVIT